MQLDESKRSELIKYTRYFMWTRDLYVLNRRVFHTINKHLHGHPSNGLTAWCVISCMSIFFTPFVVCFIFAKFDTFINKNKFQTRKKSIELSAWKIEINFIMNEFYWFLNGLFTWFDVANVLKFIILSHWICDRGTRRFACSKSFIEKETCAQDLKKSQAN